MRRPSYHRDASRRLDVKMTPMIDVIFLLLIFFVCTASFNTPEEVLPTKLSLSGAIETDVEIDPELIDLEEIVVEILWRKVGARWRARWRINGRELAILRRVDDEQRAGNVEDVLVAAGSLQADLPVILDVEPVVPIEDVIDVYDLCRQIGLERVQFAASAGA